MLPNTPEKAPPLSREESSHTQLAFTIPTLPKKEVVRLPVSKPRVRAYVARRRTVGGYVGYSGNCVATLKRAGLLPQGKVTKNGLAKTIPIKPLNIKEGEKAVVRTTEGYGTGHVVYVQKVNGQYISRIEGGYRGGVGRVVPKSVIQGEVNI